MTFLTTPHNGKQYQTIKDAVDDELIGYLFLSGKSTYNVTNHELWNKILAPNRHVFNDDSSYILKTIAFNKTIYTQLMKNVVDFEINKNLLDEDCKPMVHVLPEKVLPYMASIFTTKGHPLTDLIRKNILELFESGILNFWMKNINAKNQKIRRDVKASRDKGPVALSINHLRGVFYFMHFSVVPMVVFACEILYYKCTRKVKKLENWKLHAVVVYGKQR